MAVGSSNSFDLIVLGGGTGGYSAAFRAGQLGLKVALVDDQPRLGGTCLIWGCIPTKAMLESAELYERVKRGEEFGVPADNIRFDYATVAKRRDAIVTRLTKGIDSLVKKNKVEYIRGRGTLQGGKKVVVKTLDENGNPDGERPLDANDVILATGSRVKSLPGLEPRRHSTSSPATRRPTATRCPGSIIVVGAGAVGVEFASFYHDAGVEVTLLEYLPRVTPLEDGEVSKELERSFRRRNLPGDHQRPLRSGIRDRRRQRRVPDGRQGRRGAQGAARRADARGHGPCAQLGQRRPRVDARQGREGLRPGRRPACAPPSRTCMPSAM